jgi:hypothetical protein
MVQTRVDDLDGLPAKHDPHRLRIDDVGPPDIRLQLLRRDVAVLVAIHRRERGATEAADARRGVGRNTDVLRIDAPVVVAVDHVARHVGIAPVHVAQHVFMRYEGRGICKHAAACRVIEVTVAVDDVTHRHLEAFVQLRPQPACELQVDRVAEDDAGGGDENDRVPVAVAGPVQVGRNLDNLAGRRARCGGSLRLTRGGRDADRQQQRREDERQHAPGMHRCLDGSRY